MKEEFKPLGLKGSGFPWYLAFEYSSADGAMTKAFTRFGIRDVTLILA